MKASVLHEYGGPGKLKYEDLPDPKPGPGEVLVRVAAIGVNPVDWKMRSGAAKERFPVEFPAILGRDVSGFVSAIGEGVKQFAEGDKVFAYTPGTYAELRAVKADQLAKVPDGLEMTAAATVPLVSTTADQLIRQASETKEGQTILLTGATGSVGRCALFCALELGAKVIAGVRKKQMEEAKALGAVAAIDIDSADDLSRLGFVDAVADTVGGKVSPTLLAKLKPGGVYGTLVGPPQDAALHPLVRVNAMVAKPDPVAMVHYAEAVRDGKLALPIGHVMPLAQAAEAHAMGEKGGVGKIVLVP